MLTLLSKLLCWFTNLIRLCFITLTKEYILKQINSSSLTSVSKLPGLHKTIEIKRFSRTTQSMLRLARFWSSRKTELDNRTSFCRFMFAITMIFKSLMILFQHIRNQSNSYFPVAIYIVWIKGLTLKFTEMTIWIFRELRYVCNPVLTTQRKNAHTIKIKQNII